MLASRQKIVTLTSRIFRFMTKALTHFLRAFLLVFSAGVVSAAEGKISYNFQVKPILAEHCLKCHGQDEKQRKAKLRLDDRENSILAKSIIPGRPDESELIKRLLTHDEEEIMPPPKERRPVNEAQIALLQQWIAEGAEYEQHWSFIPPVAPPVPEIKGEKPEVVNAIDAFVKARLAKAGLESAKPALPEEWLRRVSFDLTGLPPSLEELDAFLADTSSGAEERAIKRLMDSPHYGEHMAVSWLDAARFADTYGRHEDHDSLTWPYRDWVIKAFNQNMPYDQFVTWQTAGDMLPGATQDMYLATAFNRLPQQSNEAGSDEEEFRQEIVADRVRTNGIALLGLSLECARCHDHKFDPISTKDYYSLSAFLNNIDECGLYTVYTDNVPAPSMFVYEGDDERQHTEVKLQIQMKEAARNALLPEARERFKDWLAKTKEPMHPVKPLVHLPFETLGEDKMLENLADPKKPAQVRLKTKLEEGYTGKALYFKGDNTMSIAETGQFSRTQPFSFSLWLQPHKSSDRAVVVTCSRAGLDAGSMGYELLLEEDRPSFALCHFWPGNAVRVKARKAIPLNTWTHVACTYDGTSRASGLKIYINGLPADCEVVRDNLYKDITYKDVYVGKDAVEGATLSLAGRHNDNSLTDAHVDEFMFWDKEVSAVEMRWLAGVPGMMKPDEWFAWWLRDKDPTWRKASDELVALRVEENKIAKRVKEVMTMRELPESQRRQAYVLERGDFKSRGEKVQPSTPASVFAFPEDLPRTRLGYAKWLVDKRNPLTARVFVNRIWQQFFGRGLVSTSEDFGIQGQLPSHPELLDWLAVWFMDHGWNVKELCKLIVLSETYGQSSTPKDMAQLQADPENILLSRGPRNRLTAEQLRDNALAVSGLLVRDIGGEPTKPYQPAGLWEDSGTQHIYEQDSGKNLYRRSCYTFWRRTLPPPSMSVFDAPTREFCKARRDKSSTPLQALVLFNDVQYLEADRVLAESLVKEFPADDTARVQKAFRMLTSKHASPQQTSVLVSLLQDQRQLFAASPAEADAVREKNGESRMDKSLPAVEVAATTLMTRALLGFDETLMKP
jgi:hypothetical protein